MIQMIQKFTNAWSKYNGSNVYGLAVAAQTAQYVPIPAGLIFQ
jgi:hypothetical protein